MKGTSYLIDNLSLIAQKTNEYHLNVNVYDFWGG